MAGNTIVDLGLCPPAGYLFMKDDNWKVINNSPVKYYYNSATAIDTVAVWAVDMAKRYCLLARKRLNAPVKRIIQKQ